MADHEPTLGEVYRLVLGLGHDLRDMRKDLVGRAEYEADQEGIDRRFQGSNDVHNQLDSKVSTVKSDLTSALATAKAELIAEAAQSKAELVARADKAEAAQAAIEKAQRENRAKWIFALVMAGASSILATVVPILIRGSI